VSSPVYVSDGSGVVATEFARGPWDPGAQHGGAPAALLARAFEQLPADDGLEFARLTYEFLRPVPLGPLQLEASVVRPGRRVQLLEGSVRAPDGLELVRARALQVRTIDADIPASSPSPPPAPPDQGRANDFRPPYQPMFTPDSIEIRLVLGSFHGSGPATAWFRLRRPLVDDEDPSPLQRLAAAADFGNGISTTLSWEDHLFINPDLTVYLDREPAGEWICLESRTLITSGGIGTSESVLYDHTGRVGRATQALLVGRR
jgi:hypothetical protein